MWFVSSHSNSSPGWVWALIPHWFDMVPDGTYIAASLPKYAATMSWSLLIVGSSLHTSSPTSAAAINVRIAGVGRVTVSLRKSIIDVVLKKTNHRVTENTEEYHRESIIRSSLN